MEASTNNIHKVLSDLIAQKSARDCSHFSHNQLAKAIGVERSIIHRLLHDDPMKRVTNPKIETLLKIIKFFQSDGFNITINDFLVSSDSIDIKTQDTTLFKRIEEISVFSIINPMSHAIGTVTLKVASKAKDLIALEIQEAMEPMFERGSIFIVDKKAIPMDQNIVAVCVKGEHQASIMRFRAENENAFLESISGEGNTEITNKESILGVVVQINAKT